MSYNQNFDGSVPNEPIYFSEKLNLPDITLYNTYDKRFSYPDDPLLDGAHIHDDYEIYVHVAGNCSFLVNNAIYPLSRGDVILTRPGDVHLMILNEPSVTEHFCLWFTPSCGKELLSFIENKDFCNHMSFPDEIGKKLISLFYEIDPNDKTISELKKISHVLQIILILSQKTAEAPRGVLSLPDEMQAIINYIDSEFCAIKGITDIAEKFNVSTATLNRRFKKYIHISPLEFLKAKRLSHAKKLLDGGATVTESCMRSGFSDCSYFISVFKQKFGETPYKYQKNLSE